MAGSAFEQHYNNVQNVYNVNGNLILSEASNRDDMIRELMTLRAQIDRLSGVDPQAKAASMTAVDAAISEGQQPKPQGAEIRKHLETAASTLKGAAGVAENGVKLAEIFMKIGRWVVAIL